MAEDIAMGAQEAYYLKFILLCEKQCQNLTLWSHRFTKNKSFFFFIKKMEEKFGVLLTLYSTSIFYIKDESSADGPERHDWLGASVASAQ